MNTVSLQALPVTQRALIPESYLDEMGHMNVMWYTHLFSNATGGVFDLIGLTEAYFVAHEAGAFALEQHVRYLREVRAGNHVTVRSRLLGRSAKRMHFMHFLTIEENDVLATTGEFIATHIDMTVRRSSPLPPSIAETFDRILAEHSRLRWDPPVCGVMKP
jgi:acyl-CoA thioester hydrolase